MFHRKLPVIDLAVLHGFGAIKTTIGEQFPAGVARFFDTIGICQSEKESIGASSSTMQLTFPLLAVQPSSAMMPSA